MRNLRRSFPEVKDPMVVGTAGERKMLEKNPKDNTCLKSSKNEDVHYSSNNGVELKFLDLN